MKSTFLFALAIFLFATLGRATLQAQTQVPAPQRTISETLDWWITNTEEHVVPVANALPEEQYSFAPPETCGEFHGVRTFGEMLKHLAANNYWAGALILGDKLSPEMYQETGPDSVRSKAEIVKYVKDSFIYLHKAVAAIDAGNIVAPVKKDNHGDASQKTRLSFAVDAVAHSFNHYGQLVEYLRMNGIIPPASRKASEKNEVAQ